MADFKDSGTKPSANDLLTMAVIVGTGTCACSPVFRGTRD